MELLPLVSGAISSTCTACPWKAELTEARCQANYWKAQHQRAREREAKLEQEVAVLKAKVKELDRRLLGHSSESRSHQHEGLDPGEPVTKRRRGQQPGRPGPGRRATGHLPIQEELSVLAPEDCRCGCCGLPFQEFPGTEDSEVLEIDVKAYKRQIRRRRYQPTCQCEHLPGIVTAPGPPKLIPKGRYGVSVWVTLLLDKFTSLRPTCRLLDDLRSHGLDLAMGTVIGGFKKLTPLFDPIRAEIIRKSLEQGQWHADETGWRVFVPVEGKVGWRWKLWVFHSASTVVFVLDPTREARVPETYFQDVEHGVLIVDRFSSYKAIVQVKDGRILLAFCWVHVRRDFLEIAQDWPSHRDWGLGWVDAIGALFHLNHRRLEAPCEQFAEWDQALREAVEQMKLQRDEELRDEQLHPVRRKALKSLRNHWAGLTLFVEHPEIPMDNNTAERIMRDAVCARKMFFGSYSEWSGHLAATMFSLFATLELWAINPRLWLSAYLQACAEAGGQAPPDAARWLPWNLSSAQREAMAAVADTS